MPISWSAVLPGLTLLSVLTTLSPVYAQNSTAATAAGAATGITTQAGTAMPDSSSYQATSTSASGSSASASASTSTVMVPSTAPTGKIEGDYTGALRPQVHFSPPVGFMNDPNGLFVDKNGTWHLYYQYNPTDLVAGNQHWGHATSTDLYRWDNQPIALFPPNNQSGIFSGSAVIDKNNTSGFFPDQDDGVIAIYTLNAPDSQTQEIAYSRDGGYSFEKYEGNPVIDVGSANFRDPKVIWYEDHWVMVVAYATEFVISIYTSPDLKDWTHSSNVTDIGLIGLLYECPNLVQVPVWENGTATDELAWILLISINPGAPLGGSISQYFPGTFDGYKFTPYDGIARISDFAKDNYAEQYFYGTPADQPISIAWASNWQYTNVLPTASEGWRSIMSLPRYNYLTKVERTGWEMGSLPYNIDSIKSNQFSFDSDFVNESVTVDYSNVTSGAIYFEANFTFPENVSIPANASFRLNFTSPAGDSMKAGYYFGGPNPGVAWIDRRGTKAYGDEDPLWVDRFSAAAVALTKTVSGVIDRSVFEMFVDQGAFSGTSLFFAEQPMDTMIVETQGMPEGATVKMAVWELSSGWQ